ncbi:MAG: N-6 DNA methylase, partial [Planctomycetota bacterium]
MADQRRRNKFCALGALKNESDVEQFFLFPLLVEMGFGPEYLETKKYIRTRSVGKGQGKKLYVPDYLGYPDNSKRKPVLVVDAKHPAKSAEQGLHDAQMYASLIRRHMKAPKPEQYCIGTNGHRLVVAHFDSDTPLFELAFSDFNDDNVAFRKFKKILSREALLAASVKNVAKNDFAFRTVAPVELPAIFAACHRALWKAEKRSPPSAFYEFAKLMYVKIDEDRRLRECLATRGHVSSSGSVPGHLVHFSTHWIEQMEVSVDNPIDAILFAQLTKKLEAQIAKGEKKRIFDEGEGIDLTPSTIKEAVAFMEHLDLYTVDEDLNGRLFETFLTATMRGKALGQFFTPRSVVKFMVKMAKLEATPETMDMVLDGCCGTGGFLIEAMADMNAKVVANQALTSRQRTTLHRKLRRENLWGIDAGKDPRMARIARLNMLLHKDGGSCIYFADALDKQLPTEVGLPLQTKLETDELRSKLSNTRFSCVLSNPPFSMTYTKKKPKEQAILRDYALALDSAGKPRASLRSSVMFLERYWDLLDDDGRLITVMDESVLNTLSSQPFRKYILEKFFLRAVISLPRNTFVKAQGSVKTSVLYLQKKPEPSDDQPDVFMAICANVGHSDAGKERPELNSLPSILRAFHHYTEHGKLAKKNSGQVFSISSLQRSNPTLRLDAHFFDPAYFATMNSLDKVARARGWKLSPLQELLRLKIAGGATPRGASYPDQGAKFIRVQNVRPYRIIWTEEDPCIGARTHEVLLKRSQLRAGDVVLTITGTYGIAAVVPKNFGPANINQHSVKIQVDKNRVLPNYLSVFLNSKLCRTQLDRAATGSTRLALDYPAKWGIHFTQVPPTCSVFVHGGLSPHACRVSGQVCHGCC